MGPKQVFRKEEMYTNYPEPFLLDSSIFLLQEHDLIETNPDGERFRLTDKKVLDDFLEKYYIEEEENPKTPIKTSPQPTIEEKEEADDLEDEVVEPQPIEEKEEDEPVEEEPQPIEEKEEEVVEEKLEEETPKAEEKPQEEPKVEEPKEVKEEPKEEIEETAVVEPETQETEIAEEVRRRIVETIDKYKEDK